MSEAEKVERGSNPPRPTNNLYREALSDVSFMPNIASQVRLKDGRMAWVSKITAHGDDDRVVLEDGSEIVVDQMEDIAEIIGEEAPMTLILKIIEHIPTPKV